MPLAAAGLARCALVALDLDGTTLDGAGRMSARTAEAVRATRARGVEVVIVSGRPLAECLALAERHGLHGWVGASNGAVVGELGTGRVLRSAGFAPAAAAALVARRRAETPELRLGAVADDVLALDVGFPEQLARTWGHLPAGGVEAALGGDRDVRKILAAHPDGLAVAERMMARAARSADLPAEVTRSSDDFLELSAPAVDKGAAVRWIAERRGLDPARCAAVGDMPNDLPMLAAVGLPLAVANAHPDVLAAAHTVLPRNVEDGVAQALEAAGAVAGRGPETMIGADSSGL